jgi:hypothetical protein
MQLPHWHMLLSSFSCCSALPGEETQMLQGGQRRMFACLAAGEQAAEAAAAVPAAAAVLPRQPRPVLRRQLQLPAAAASLVLKTWCFSGYDMNSVILTTARL